MPNHLIEEDVLSIVRRSEEGAHPAILYRELRHYSDHVVKIATAIESLIARRKIKHGPGGKLKEVR